MNIMGKTRTRRMPPILDVFDSAYQSEEAKQKFEEKLNEEQLLYTELLIDKELRPNSFREAYLAGYRAAEIADRLGYTKQYARRYVVSDNAQQKGLDKEEHSKNRKALESVRNWYLFVFLSDEAGDFRQMKPYFPPSVQKQEGTLYAHYIRNGGKKLEGTYFDPRREVSGERREILLNKLKEQPIEKVAFYERLYIDTLEKMAEDANIDIIWEKDLYRTEYTIKYYNWISKKNEENQKLLEIQKEERKRKKALKEAKEEETD